MPSSLSQGEAPRYQAPKRRRGSVERDRVIPLFGRSDPLAGAPLRRRSPGPVETAGTGCGDCPGRNPGALEAPDASSPSRAESSGPWVEPGGSEPGCAMAFGAPGPGEETSQRTARVNRPRRSKAQGPKIHPPLRRKHGAHHGSGPHGPAPPTSPPLHAACRMKTMKRVIPANEAKPRPSRDARMRTLVIPAEAKRRAGTHPPLSQGRTDRAAVRWGKTLTPSYPPPAAFGGSLP